MSPPKPHRNRESAKAFRGRMKERKECIVRLVVPIALKEEVRALVAAWLAEMEVYQAEMVESRNVDMLGVGKIGGTFAERADGQTREIEQIVEDKDDEFRND